MPKLITKCVLDMETLRWIPELEESRPYSGLWELAFGASEGDNANSQSERDFMSTLQGEQATQFANEQQAQNQVQQAWSPIVAGGAYQYGFSTAEDQELHSQIINQVAQATQNTENASLLREQQESGGASSAPTGADAAVNAQVAATGAQNTGNELVQEKEEGYQQGSKLFQEGTAAEEDVATLANPNGAAGAATGAAGAANQSQQMVDAGNANSLTSKLLGGAISGGVSALTGGLSNMAGGGTFGTGVAETFGH